MIWIVMGCAIFVGVMIRRAFRDAREERERPERFRRVYGL